MPRNHFSFRRVLLCTLPLLVLVLWIVALVESRHRRRHRDRGIAGPHVGAGPVGGEKRRRRDARDEHRGDAEGLGGPARRGGAAAAVRAAPRSRSAASRIAGGEQSYQFNVSRALGQASGGSAEVEVAVIDRGGGPPPSGADALDRPRADRDALAFLQLRRGARQHLDHLGFGVGVALQPIGRDLAQVLQRRANEPRHPRAAPAVVVILAAPRAHPLADGVEPLQHRIDERAVAASR